MRYLVFIIIVILLNGCTVAKAVVAMNKCTDDFLVLENDSRVKYEAGAEVNAQIVANSIDKAIEEVEKTHYGKFAMPINIYVLATIDSFSSFCVFSKAGGCVLNERLFISPKEENTPDRISGILTHELSHLYMEQYLGMWKWNSNVPSWFREGLAVYASGGAGAERISLEEAKKAISSKKMFVPNETGSLLFPKTAHTFGLKPRMFYRQAALFVGWLHDRSKQSFKNLISSILAGEAFEGAMRSAYGAGVIDNWQNFIDEQKT